MAFVKLDCGILDSSLWTVEDAETRVVFITMLAMSDSEGLCRATAPGIAARARIPLPRARKALERLEAPDPDDRSGVAEGRRVVRCAGGYQITNYMTYRAHDYTSATRMRRLRERRRVTASRNVTNRNVTQGEGEAEAEGEEEASSSVRLPKESPPPALLPTTDHGGETERRAADAGEKQHDDGTGPGFAQFWAAYPKKVAKGSALNAWHKYDRPPKVAERIIAAAAAFAKHPDARRDGGRYLPNPGTWLEQRRWEDEAPATATAAKPAAHVLPPDEIKQRIKHAAAELAKRRAFRAKKGGAV